ncbi:MAG: Ig domain-containing protein [Burkholderiaceae bacterium]
MMNMYRRARGLGLRAWTGLALTIGLSACGGGGGSSGADLTINYNYANANNSTMVVFRSEALPAPQVDGLEGHAPHFAVVSGGLPEGVTLDPNTGVISGRPVANTETTAVIRLTVTGYSGSLDESVKVTVAPFTVMYLNTSVETQRGLPLAVNTPIVPSYDEAVSVEFKTWPEGTALPPGITLNATTGALAGTPTEAGSYAVFLVATASYGGHTSQADARVDYFVSPITDMGFGYDGIQAEAGQATSITPYKTLLEGDTLTNFHVVAGEGTGIPGMSVNAATGVISGTLPSTAGDYNMVVEATFTRGSIVETRRGEWSVSVYVP